MSDEGPLSDGEGLTVDTPYEVANWRPLVNWILVIPHSIIQGVLGYVVGVVGLIYWLIFLFTGNLNRGLYGFMAMTLRYSARAYAFLYGFTERYPPFEFPTSARDDGGYPGIRLELPEPPEGASRTALANFILAIPHYFMLFVYGIVAGLMLFVAWFAVLFTGRWPRDLRGTVVKVANYAVRIWRYVVMVDTKYPSFSLGRP